MRPTVKLWEIATILNWRAYSQNELLEKWKYPVLRVWNFFTNSNWYYSDLELEDDKYCNKWDLLYAWSASFWPKIWEWWKTIYHYHIRKINLSEKIDKNYLYHYLFWDSQAIKQHWHWVAMMHITKWDMEKKEIPLPPLETQKAIVAKLDQIFAELDQTKSEIQKNLDNTDELWKSALNQAFQGDWEMKKLDNIVDFSQWIQVPIEDQSMVEKPWLVRFLRIIDFTQWWQEPRYVENFWDRYYVNNDDLSMVRYGATTWFICSWMEWIIANNLFKITPKKENILKKYLYVYFKSPYFDRFLQKEVFWAAMPAISFWALKNVEISIPPLSEQEKIVEHLDQVSKEVKALKSQYQSQLDNLEKLKKSVLDKAFRWELGE